MRFLKSILFLLMMLPVAVFAQGVEMAEVFRSNGKIYVVIGVIAIVFIGLIIYLISIDRKLSKLEKEK